MGSQKKFGTNLKKARVQASMTQKEIAEKSGLHVNFIARIERGEENPTYETIERIVKALKIKSSDILPF